MQRSSVTGHVVLAAIALLCGLASAGDDDVWVSADGHHHRVLRHLGDGTAVEGATEFDLADLREGQTRHFGAGDKQVTVSRDGSEATILRAAANDDAGVTVRCRIGVDSCKILTFDDDPARVMVVVEKTRNCGSGAGDCDIDVEALEGLGEAHARVLVHRATECPEGEDCAEFVDITRHGVQGHRALAHFSTGPADGEQIVVIGEGAPGHVLFQEPGNRATLRCPEGDTTMHVDREEADDVFLCPKHSTPLEKSAHKPHIRRLAIEKPSSQAEY